MVVKHLPALSSDHNPLLLCLDGVKVSNSARCPFRFESAWLNHPQFLEFHWNSTIDPCSVMAILKEDLIRIKDIQLALNRRSVITCLLQREFFRKILIGSQLRKKFCGVRNLNWLNYGDRNTTFFHASNVIRRRRNTICALKWPDGPWIFDPRELEDHAVTFFKSLYFLPEDEIHDGVLNRGGFPMILVKEATEEEITRVIKGMCSLKAPCLDGFQPIFYKACWPSIEASVCRFVNDFMSSTAFPEGANDTLISLIRKV
ncbi:LOW QUALITY PROTEIN: hypothetical protein V2J09_010556 [Rumex salicifolius]